MAFTFGCFAGIDQDDAILVEEPVVAFDQKLEIVLVSALPFAASR